MFLDAERGKTKKTYVPIVRKALFVAAVLAATHLWPHSASAQEGQVAAREFDSLRQAIEDLQSSFGREYPNAGDYLNRLDTLSKAGAGAEDIRLEFNRLRREALLANPLLDIDGILLIRRRVENLKKHEQLGFPSNHECNTSLNRKGHDNEIAVLSPIGPNGKLRTLHRPLEGGYVGETDLHWNGDRFLFTQSDPTSWKVWEMKTDGTGLRQISRMPDDVDAFDACYMPDGRIVFGCTASYQSVPCWHGARHLSNLYIMDGDGRNVRQVCFDQDHNFHPSIMPNGQVLYHRWDYTGINHIFMRQLMVMNPDGTCQRAVYGSNSWFPNSLYFPRALPGDAEKIVCILSGYHGVHRMGQLVIADTSQGWHAEEGLVQRISGRGQSIEPKIADVLVDGDWPKFLHPYPLSDKYFLVSGWMNANDNWGIYLADVFDNVVLIHRQPGQALLEPVPLMKRRMPPPIPDRVDLDREDGVVYLHDVYAGPGLKGVPRGTIKSLRVLAYHFGYRGLAGPHKIGRGGPWESMRILGNVPLESDGSAMFRAPANTPIAVQALDSEGKAVQLMRSWFTLMPGESLSCLGCHETPADTAPSIIAAALDREPREIEPWYGPARGFDFAREVQPVLNKYCVQCHDGKDAAPDLRPEDHVPDYTGSELSMLGRQRLHPAMKNVIGTRLKYTPAYEALIPFIRRVGVEDDVSLLTPGEYHADTSELVQLLRKGHAGVRLDDEAWDRLIAWIDLNGPCHGTWNDVFPVPDNADERRRELQRMYGGPADDFEAIPETPPYDDSPVAPVARPEPIPVSLAGWPMEKEAAAAAQAALGARRVSIDLGEGVTIELVRIPAGKYVLGDRNRSFDGRPPSVVSIQKPFWMGTCEVTNEQFRRFEPDHDSHYYQKRHARDDDRGLTLNEPDQPAVRVSWDRAQAFCDWLSERTGKRFLLPTEEQWEYACRAGTATALFYGNVEDDFSKWANLGDASFGRGHKPDGDQITGGLNHMVIEGAELADKRFDDGARVTTAVGSYRPNVWGLCDMHGNAAEWTRSEADRPGRKIVRGGSFYDRPERSTSAVRYDYPHWQRVFNTGFRVVCIDEPA